MSDTKIFGADGRWPQALEAGGFTPISNFFLKSYSLLSPEITSAEAIFIIHLLSFKWAKEHPYPRFKVLGDLMGVSTSSVRSYGRSLDRKGYLKRINRDHSSSMFDLSPLFDILEKRFNEIKQNDSKLKKVSQDSSEIIF